MRIEPRLLAGEAFTATVAWEQRLEAGLASGTLALPGAPSGARPAYRLADFEPQIAAGAGFRWSHELDRAYAAWHLGRFDLSAGRQALGWGRGALLSAVDLFAPFSPLEVDREFRPGVDALRAEVRVADQDSIEGVAALGRSFDASIFAARARGYRGQVDAEIVGGRRARDAFAGASASAAVGEVELHGEAIVFRLPERWLADGLLGRRWIPRALAGASWVAPVGPGLALAGEYLYSGFGVPRSGDLTPWLLSPAFSERYRRGDFQLLGRHALAVVASYETGISGAASFSWVHDPADGSGILTPGFSWTPDDRLSLRAAVFVPYGRLPVPGELGSQFGAAPLTVFVQLAVADAIGTR